MKIEEIIKELIQNGINVSGVSIRNNELAYTIDGFAKSGSGTLFLENGKMILETRYNQLDEVFSTEDVSNIAYHWDKDYSFSSNYPKTNFVTEKNPWYKLYEKYDFV